MRIKEAREKLKLLEDRRAVLREDAQRLILDFRRIYPRGRTPVYLTRAADHSHTPLRWRITEGNGRRIEITSEDGVRLLRTLPSATCTHLMDFERERLALNYSLSTTAYDCDRLASYLIASEKNRLLKKTLNPES